MLIPLAKSALEWRVSSRRAGSVTLRSTGKVVPSSNSTMTIAKISSEGWESRKSIRLVRGSRGWLQYGSSSSIESSTSLNDGD